GEWLALKLMLPWNAGTGGVLLSLIGSPSRCAAYTIKSPRARGEKGGLRIEEGRWRNGECHRTQRMPCARKRPPTRPRLRITHYALRITHYIQYHRFSTSCGSRILPSNWPMLLL